MSDYTPSPEAVEAAARALAGMEPGEDWPTNEALGGSLTGTRDDEFRDGVRADATAALTAAGPIIAAEALREKAQRYREAGENGFLFLPGSGLRVPWEAVADDLDRTARGAGS